MLKKICYFVVHILHFFKSEAAGPWDNGPAFINRFKTDVENFLTKPHSAASEKVASYLHHAPRYAFSPQESRKQKGYFDRVGSTTRIGTLNGHKHFFGHSFDKKSEFTNEREVGVTSKQDKRDHLTKGNSMIESLLNGFLEDQWKNNYKWSVFIIMSETRSLGVS